MKIKALCLLILCLCGMPLAQAQITNFQHIIVVFQENRTPDNLFHGLCTAPFGSSSSCSTHPTGSQYNIQTSNWLDNTSSTKTTNPRHGRAEQCLRSLAHSQGFYRDVRQELSGRLPYGRRRRRHLQRHLRFKAPV